MINDRKSFLTITQTVYIERHKMDLTHGGLKTEFSVHTDSINSITHHLLLKKTKTMKRAQCPIILVQFN